VSTSRRTLAHYDESAERFWEGTKDHDVSQNIDALLGALAGNAPFHVLDFGCGPGRDLATFTRRGHLATGLDGAIRFVEMARAHSGCEVWHQDFLDLSLPPARFDGIFANASLFHVPSENLPQVLTHLRATLKPQGVLFVSVPRGDAREGWSGDRYGCYFQEPDWRALIEAAGFVQERHYYRPEGLPRPEQPWLAMVNRRTPG
jgi:SAM-dependent methyltransferase